MPLSERTLALLRTPSGGGTSYPPSSRLSERTLSLLRPQRTAEAADEYLSGGRTTDIPDDYLSGGIAPPQPLQDKAQAAADYLSTVAMGGFNSAVGAGLATLQDYASGATPQQSRGPRLTAEAAKADTPEFLKLALRGRAFEAPSAADLSMEGLKALAEPGVQIPADVAGQIARGETPDVEGAARRAGYAYDVRRPGALADEAPLYEGKPGLRAAQAVAQGAGTTGLGLTTDPSTLVGVGAAQRLAALKQAGAGAEALTAVEKAAEGARRADAVLDAASLPSLTSQTYQDAAQAYLAGKEKGWTSPEALEAGSRAAMSGAMAGAMAHGLPGEFSARPAEPARPQAETPSDVAAEYMDRKQVEAQQQAAAQAAEQAAIGQQIIDAGEGFDPLEAQRLAAQRAQGAEAQAELDQMAAEGLPSQRTAAEQEARRQAEEQAQAAAEAEQRAAYDARQAGQRASQERMDAIVAPTVQRMLQRPELVDAAGRPLREAVQDAPPEAQAPEFAPIAQPDGEQAAKVETGAPEGTEARQDPELRKAVQGFLEDNPDASRDDLAAEIRKLRTELDTDALTGLGSKRKWTRTLQELDAAPDPSARFLFADMRGAKKINDTLGHDAGDEAIKAMAGLWRKHFGDDTARTKGDEFEGVLRGVPDAEIPGRLEAFRTELAAQRIPVQMPDGRVLDLQPLQAHLGFGRTPKEADLAANAAREVTGSGREAAPAAEPPADALPAVGGPDAGVRGGDQAGREAPPPQLAPPGVPAGKWAKYLKAREREIEADRPNWRRVPDPPADAEGNPILPGQEDWTPAERSAARVHAEATLRQIEMDQQSQPVGARQIIDPRGAGAGSTTGEYLGVTSHKKGTAFENVTAKPSEMRLALRKDKGNPLELELLDAARSDLDAMEPAEGGDASFDPEDFGERYATKPTPGQRGLAGIAEDVPERGARPKGPEQTRMFGGEMLQGTEARVTEGRERGGPLFTQDADARAKAEKDAQGGLKFAAGEQPRAPVTRQSVERAFPTGKVSEAGEGDWHVDLPGNRRVRVRVEPDGIQYKAEAFKRGYGREKRDTEQVVGSWRKLGQGGIIQLAKVGADEGTLAHEVFHSAMDLALSPREREAVLRRYKGEEAAAEAYAKWEPRKVSHGVFAKIRDFFRGLYRSLFPDAESVFRRVRSGEAYGTREGAGASGPKYAAREDSFRQLWDGLVSTYLPGTPVQEVARRFRLSIENTSDSQADIDAAEPFVAEKLRGPQTVGTGSKTARATEPASPSIKLPENTPSRQAILDRAFRLARLEPGALAAERAALLADEPALREMAKTLYVSGGKTPAALFDKVLAFSRRVEDNTSPLGEPKYATAPKEPPVFKQGTILDAEGKPIRKDEATVEKTRARGPVRPIPPEKIATQVSGRPVQPGESPRVEHRVESLRVAEKAADVIPAELDRETKQSWKSLDPEVQKILREYDDDKFYTIMKRRQLEAPEVQAWDARVRGKQEAMAELNAKVREGDPKGEAARDLAAATLDFIAAQRAAVNDGTGTARALAARARVMDASRTPDDRFLRQVFREIPKVSDKQAADLVRAYREDPDALLPLLQTAIGRGRMAKALELFKANLLSAFSTDVANLSGNLAEHHIEMVETGLASGIDWALQRVYGGDRARHAGEMGAEWAGANQAFAPALKNLGRNLKDVFTLKDKPIDLNRRLEHQVGAIGGTFGKVVRTSFGKLEAADAFFKEWGGGAELAKQAYRKAASELPGKTPKEIGKRADEILRQIADPENGDHVDIIRNVERSKERRTFQETRPKSLTEWVGDGVRRMPIIGFAIPFHKTPGNIANRIIERSPLGFKKAGQVYTEFREAQAKQARGEATAAEVAEARGKLADAIASPLLGTALLGAFTAAAKAGLLTGSGPTDEKDRNMLRSTKWQPYSLVLPDGQGGKVYIPVNRFEPISSLLGFAADMSEAKDAKNSADLFQKAVGSIVQNLTSKSYLQGLANLGDLIGRDPLKAAGEFTKDLTGAVVPNIVNRAAQAVDPKMRDTRPARGGPAGIVEGIGKTIASRIPGVSTMLPERRSGTGDVIERPGNALTRFASPVQPSRTKKGTELESLLVQIDAVPSAPLREIVIPRSGGRKVRLTTEEYQQLQDADKAASDYLRKVISSDGFRRADQDAQRSYVRRVYDTAGEQAKRRLMMSPAFQKRAREAQ